MLTIKKPFCVLILNVLIFTLLISCASSPFAQNQSPLWITDIDAVYPDEDYLAAVGYAQDRIGAEAAATFNLSKILKQKVDAESTATESFENNFQDQSREYQTTVNTSSVIDEITGLEIQETYTAKDGTVYALAAIDRKEVGTYYKQKVDENEEIINARLTFMIDNEATFEGVASAKKALAIAYENEVYAELLSVINPSLYKSIDLSYKNSNAIAILIELEKQKIYVGVAVNNDVDSRVAFSLSETFKTLGYKSDIVPMSTIPSFSMPYVLFAELSVEPFSMTSSQNNKYVRFILNTELVDVKNKTFLPWSISGREAHITEDEAAQRAIRTIENEIEKEYIKEIQKLEQ